MHAYNSVYTRQPLCNGQLNHTEGLLPYMHHVKDAQRESLLFLTVNEFPVPDDWSSSDVFVVLALYNLERFEEVSHTPNCLD